MGGGVVGGGVTELNQSDNASKVRRSKSLDKAPPVKRFPSKSKTLSFRSELANKIAKRATLLEDVDVIDDDEIKILYENLLESDNEMEEEEEEEMDDDNDDDESTFDSSQLSSNAQPSEVTTRSKSRPENAFMNLCRSSRTLPRGVSAIRSHTMHGTMKKNTCNSVIVMSGGDGYCDWNKPGSGSKVDDASLLLWIYKI